MHKSLDSVWLQKQYLQNSFQRFNLSMFISYIVEVIPMDYK